MRDFCSPVLGGERSATQRHPLLTGRHFRALTAFDSHQRRVNEAGLKRAGSRRPARDKATAAATVERIDRVIQRLSVSFQIEETGELEYPAELERLRRQRDIYAAEAADEPDPAERAGLMEALATADPRRPRRRFPPVLASRAFPAVKARFGEATCCSHRSTALQLLLLYFHPVTRGVVITLTPGQGWRALWRSA